MGFSKGIHIMDSGRTGAPVGRPRLGSLDKNVAESLLTERCPYRTIDELRGCLGRSKPSAEALAVRADLAAAVREICQGRRVNRKALAEALECGIRTIDRFAV
jgi:hypothetical protein